MRVSELSEAPRNTALVTALARQAPVPELLDALLDGGPLLLLVVVGPEGSAEGIITGNGPDGSTCLFAFSGPDGVAAYQATQEQPQSVVAVDPPIVLDVARQAQVDVLVIDGAGPVPAAVPLSWLSQRYAERGRVVPQGTEVYVGAPAFPVPPDVEEAVRRTVRSSPDVSTAYLFALSVGGADARVVVGVVPTGVPGGHAAATFAPALGEQLPQGDVYDVLELDQEQERAVAGYVPALR
jgi:hypothetical protein